MAKQWHTVLVSVVAHIVAIFFLVVIPLLATDMLPSVNSMTRYVPVELKTPPTPEAPAPVFGGTTAAVPVAGPPIEAPTTIEAERPERPAVSNLQIVDGAIGVPGGGAAIVDTVAPPPPRPVPQEPVRPGGNVKAPNRIGYVAPVYPPTAMAARVSGTVIIEAVIGTDGTVRDAKVLRSVTLLDDAALTAVRQWRYTPTTLNGIPVPVIMTVTVTFQLGG